MALADLTRPAVEAALREARRLGREAFLTKYGFRRARSYFVRWKGQSFDSKAIAGAAHGYLRNESPLSPSEFSGGDRRVVPILERLGFDIDRPGSMNGQVENKPEVPSLHFSTSSGHRSTGSAVDSPYWVFVCNPKRWAVDRFLEQRIEYDTWGVRKSDRARFAPGQLGIVRVGTDRRTAAERDGRPRLEPGIYAICEVESAAVDGTGASDGFWAGGEGRAPGWPTVKLRYLRNCLSSPLTIERMRLEAPKRSRSLLYGLEAASFPITAQDFHRVLTLFGVESEALVGASVASADVSAEDLVAVEQKYLNACPEVKERVSRNIERGAVGALVKRATGFKCQVCEALGRDPLGFVKTNGERYVEAHHVMPVAKREVGSLAASNIMTLCANHHRQMHYGGVQVAILAQTFAFVLDGTEVNIPRTAVFERSSK